MAIMGFELGFKILDDDDRATLTAEQRSAFTEMHNELVSELVDDLRDEQLTS